MSQLQVGGHQLFLATEEVVERSLGHAGALDDPVDADSLDALGVEELVRSSEKPLSSRGSGSVWTGAEVLTRSSSFQTDPSSRTAVDEPSVMLMVTRSA